MPTPTSSASNVVPNVHTVCDTQDREQITILAVPSDSEVPWVEHESPIGASNSSRTDILEFEIQFLNQHRLSMIDIVEVDGTILH
jgi:hypothetical protein